jgi:hypothetical protein
VHAGTSNEQPKAAFQEVCTYGYVATSNGPRSFRVTRYVFYTPDTRGRQLENDDSFVCGRDRSEAEAIRDQDRPLYRYEELTSPFSFLESLLKVCQIMTDELGVYDADVFDMNTL